MNDKKKPKPKKVICKYCHKTFLAEPIEIWGENDYDVWIEGYGYPKTCGNCFTKSGTKEHWQRLYNEGLISKEELDQKLKKIKKSINIKGNLDEKRKIFKSYSKI